MTQLTVIAEQRASTFRFDEALDRQSLRPLAATTTTTLQINVGKRCNQACHHCHVEAGPNRTEMMTAAVADRVLELLAADGPDGKIDTVDITGGAPELSPEFRRLVTRSRELGKRVIDRCNLTILFEPGQEDLAAFLADQRVDIVASLPCYGPENVEEQRGKGVFDKSIAAVRMLNAFGYAQPKSGLTLDLVYNPVGASLPPPQAKLELDYKRVLGDTFGISFDQLFTITNVPIRRFAHQLARDGELEAYMCLLVKHFNPATVPGLMCRSQISVGYDGKLYDCDFNQMLELGVDAAAGANDIFELASLAALNERPIVTRGHCFACTAGAGSSCGGAIA